MSQAWPEVEIQGQLEPSLETGIVHSIASPLSFWKWIKNLLIHPAIFSAYAKTGGVVDTPPSVDPDHIVVGSLIKTYPLDGYVPSTTQLARRPGPKAFFRDEPYKARDGALFVLRKYWLSSTRPASVYHKVGFLQVLLSWVKASVMFVLKAVVQLLMLPLNILKLATEFLPELIVNYTGKGIGQVVRTLADLRQLESKSDSLRMTGDRLNRNQQAAAKFQPEHYPVVKMIGVHVLGFLWLAILLPFHYVARLVGFVGEALTSPEKSARDAWEFGARVRPRALGYILGTLGAAFSLALTTVLWMITLPFVVTGILTLVPQLVPVLASIAQWPVIASSLSFIQGTFSLVAGSLPAAFGAIATAMSGALGLSVSNLVLAVTVTAAVIAAPVLTIGSRIVDELSNSWARWKADRADKEFQETLSQGFLFAKSSKNKSGFVELNEEPSSGASGRVENSAASLRDSASHLDKMEEFKDYKVNEFKKLEKGFKRVEVDTRLYMAI